MASTAPERRAEDDRRDGAAQRHTGDLAGTDDMSQDKRDFIRALASERDSPSTGFEIVCKGTTFKVHRVITGMHSRYFKRLCEGAFSESGERRVVLKGDSLAAVRAMIDYFYTFDYAEPIINPVDRAAEDEDPEPRAVLEAHAHVYALGDKYDIEGTSDLAVQKFRDCAGELSRNDDDPAVQSRFTEPADGFVTATEFVYKNSSAGDRMRRLLLDWWCDGENLLEHIDIHAWETLLADVPGFSSEFIAELTGITIGERRAT